MLRELITWVLNTYLGKYLENFNPAQLSVGLLSGEVELENVPFRKDALRGLGIPLQALSGNIGKIKLQIPVRQFRTAPWCIIIERVNIVIGPKNLNDWNDEKEKQSDLEYKLSQLDDDESRWRAKTEDSNESAYYASSYSSWLSFGTGLATNIIENLQLKINDVHIRYEDTITIPNCRFACGITIDTLSAQSCDANWIPGFTTAWNQDISLKLVELKSFAFYWDRLTVDTTCSDAPSSDLAQLMHRICSDKHRYIIKPISAQAHFKRDRSLVPLRTRNRPRLSCEVVVSEISLCLSDFQYKQIVDCLRGLEGINKLRIFRVLRPSYLIKDNPRLWWKYAAKCHGYVHEHSEEKWLKVKQNIRYIKLHVKLLANPSENLSQDDKKFKCDVEKIRSLDELKILRQVCFLQLLPSDLKFKSQNVGNQGKTMLFQWFPQWWGWYGNATPVTGNTPSEIVGQHSDTVPADENSNTLEDDILNALEGSFDSNSLLKRDAVFGKFDFYLAKGQINVCSENYTTSEMNVMMEMYFDKLQLNIETRPRSGSHLIALSLGSVCVKDLITTDTRYPDLIKLQMKEDQQQQTIFGRFQNAKIKKEVPSPSFPENIEPWFQLQYEKKPLAFNTDYRLAVKTKSLDVVYNIGALRWLIDFFAQPVQNQTAKQKIEKMKNSTKMRLIKNWKSIFDSDLIQRKSWSFDIDVSAPQIIFVESFTNPNASLVLVDFGRFQLLKNATQDRFRQRVQKNTDLESNSETYLTKQIEMESEDEDAFMTPCSTPPGSKTSLSDSPTMCSAAPDFSGIVINQDTGLEDAFHDKIYDKYSIDLTDLQVLVCRGKERWGFASLKTSSALHVLDRFNITLQLERRVVHTSDPEYPSLTLFGSLPKLVAHVNEHKITALNEILNIITSESNNSKPKITEEKFKTDFNISDSKTDSVDSSIGLDNAEITYNRHANLIILQFVIDQMSLEVQSRGRSIAELQVTGVRAGLSRLSGKTNITLSVHGLLLVDAIQSFGPDFELLVASHRHVGMDSVSGSLKQSEPCSPTSPASPDPHQDWRPTSPQTITKAISSLQREANSAIWSYLDDLDALITLEINLITSDDDKENLQIANITFNNLDIIANQETIVELLGFVNRVFPKKKTKSKLSEIQRVQPEEFSREFIRRPTLPKHFNETINSTSSKSVRTEITFDFHRLNVLVLRALIRDSYTVGRKVGTFTMSEAKIYATLGQEISVEGSLGGLQILDLTPEGINHQRILSVGKDPLTDPPEIEPDLLVSLTQEVYGLQSKDKLVEQGQALSFKVSRDITATVSIKIRMASVWYTHCARFMQELSWCANEFKHYLKNFARSIRDKATDMAIGLVQPLNNPHEVFVATPLDEGQPNDFSSPRKSRSRKKVTIKVDVILDTPVLVVPRSSCSAQVLVAHLGKITVNNFQKTTRNSVQRDFSIDEREIFTIDEDDFYRPEFQTEGKCEEIIRTCDIYSIDVRNMNLFSLDTTKRKGFRFSALPRAEEFYSCKTDAVAILHDTAIRLEVIKYSEESTAFTLPSKSLEADSLYIKGNVTEDLKISLSRQQYEQLLETIDNIFKVPEDLVRPPTEVSADVQNMNGTDDDAKQSSFELNQQISEPKIFHRRNTSEQRKDLTPKISFTLPIFIIQLKNEQDNPLIEISFREFSVQYEKNNICETKLQVMLRSILMEDLKCPIDSKYRQMVVSSSQEQSNERSINDFTSTSTSCPDLVRLQSNDNVTTGSLPENLEVNIGFERCPTNPVYLGCRQNKLNSPTPLYPETPPPSPEQKSCEDNLVIYSALLIDPNCHNLSTKYKNKRQTSSIDFNCLNLIICVERWFLLLDFFGLLSENDHENQQQDKEKIVEKDKTKGNTELEITVRSLNLEFIRNESDLAKANVSNAFFVISKYDDTKVIEGRLGSVSLFDLSPFGRVYREKFLTSGTEALKFIYKSEGEKLNQRSLKKESTLKIQMSSVRYVHTKRFVLEIQAFIKEFLQLQTPVMKRIKSTDPKYNMEQRPSQMGLEISAGSPIVLLPLSFESNQVIVADLGEFTLANNFHYISDINVISQRNDLSLLPEILDVMMVDLVNTNLFTGNRVSKNDEFEVNEKDSDICLDMGSYRVLKMGNSLFKEKCHLKVQVERNMDSWKSNNCPDISVQGTLSRLEGVLNLEQYKLVRGFLMYNLGENTDDVYNFNPFNVADSKFNSSSIEVEKLENKVWTNMSINLDLEDVSVVLNWCAENTSPQYESQEQSLACINFIKSSLKIDSYSDSSQDIDLVSQEILITDNRFNKNQYEIQKNVFTNILQPIRTDFASNVVQAEIHSRKRDDHSKFTILLNNMRLMAIIDWIENMQEYLNENAELPSTNGHNSNLVNFRNVNVQHGDPNIDVDKAPMEIILNITDSELVFVEKTDILDTNAIILKSTTVFSFKTNELIKPISVNLNHLEVFSCILGHENESALSIIDPITINVELKNNRLDIQTQKNLCIRLSYHDVKMFTRMMKSLPKQTRTAQKKTKQTSQNKEDSNFLINRLSAVGFSKADCRKALELCGNNLDSAALWLTQNKEPLGELYSGRENSSYNNKSLEINSISISAQCLSICVIDDCKDADVPLLELSLSQLSFKQGLSRYLFSTTAPGLTGFCCGHLKAIIASDYYNRSLSGWEPIVEPWECIANWNYSNDIAGVNRSRLNLSINSDKQLKLNITSTLIELWQLVRTNWTQDYYEGSGNTTPSFSTNISQSPTCFKRRVPFVPFSLRNDTGEHLSFKILLTQPGGITRTEITTDNMMTEWISVLPNEIVPFTFGQQSKLRHLDSHKLNLHQILVEVKGWSQVGPVSIDKVGVFFRHATKQELPKARIVFDVTLKGSAQKLITVRSALRVVNKLETTILLKMEQPNEKNSSNRSAAVNLTKITPLTSFSVPLSQVRSLLYFNPVKDQSNIDDKNGNNVETPTYKAFLHDLGSSQASIRNIIANGKYQFCEKGIDWTICQEDIVQEQRFCRLSRDNYYNILSIIKREGYPVRDGIPLPGHTITLIPPLRITNLLCCDLLFKIGNHTHGRIYSSVTANVHEINLDEPINLSITLDNYKVSGQLTIPFGHTGIVEPKLRLLDTQNRDLFLRATIQSVKGAGMEISISSPFWLVNKTGLPLVFRQEGVTHPASGQFEEHETARVVTPLMFSFSDPDASPSLEIRLGTRYGNSPQWCQSISLHKDIIHRHLKAGDSNETFAVGVEVRRGRGRYSRTSVVTFSPRFQLYNRSSHKLQFAQKCFVSKMNDSIARSTIINAVPGCHFAFHWPRSDLEPLLCVQLADVECCYWSSGIPINEAQSLYINIRNDLGEMHFLRLEVILQGATYFLLFGDAHSLPPPIRIDNYSEVSVNFFQDGCKPEWRTSVRPHSSLAYALDDPIGHQFLQIEAPGGHSHIFPLRDLNMSSCLTYSNFIYISFKGTFHTPSISENLYMSSEFDIESQHLVLSVNKDKKVILMRKCAGDRSQLWLMNSSSQIEHEGSSPPTEPGKKSSYPRLVLDLEKAPNPMDFTNLVVRPPNKQRELTQTWRFENNRLMCRHTNMCVQSRNGVYGLHPGSEAVFGRIESDRRPRNNNSVPMEQLIECQKLRPGSGQLELTIRMDGPIKTILIRDVKSSIDIPLAPDPLWKHASAVTSSNVNCRQNNVTKKSTFVDDYYIKLNLTKGLGISIISRRPCEELAYITLENITLEAVATPFVGSIDLNVGDMQIDNQLLDTPCPILLYTIKSPTLDFPSQSALVFNAKMLPSPNENAVIFERVILSLKPFVLYLEERLILKTGKFLGLGQTQHSATSLVDESEFEAQQVATKILAANAKRYYFENLQLSPTQLRLSVITASKLSSQLMDMKKKLGLTLIKFEDVLIEFDKFADKHHFETLEVYLRAIKSHYKNQLKWHAASILGSVDFLGNPLGFANDLSEGVSSLIFEGSVKSLVKNVTHGISNSTAKLTETISDGLGRVVLDEQDNEARQKILEVASGSNTSGEHLAAGLKGLGFGLLGGVTSIVRYTYEGAQSDGIHGFISGLGKGIVGTVTKPIIGVLDLASETASAVRETSKSAHRVLPERKRLPRCVSGAPGGLLPPYSSVQSKGQQYLHLINKRTFSEQIMSYEPNLGDDKVSKLRLLVSTEYVRIFSRTEEDTTIMLQYHLSDVLSSHPVTVNKPTTNSKSKKPICYIEISSSSQTQLKRPRVRCQSEEMAEKASRHINYAKSVYEEREHTLNNDLTTSEQ